MVSVLEVLGCSAGGGRAGCRWFGSRWLKLKQWLYDVGWRAGFRLLRFCWRPASWLLSKWVKWWSTAKGRLLDGVFGLIDDWSRWFGLKLASRSRQIRAHW